MSGRTAARPATRRRGARTARAASSRYVVLGSTAGIASAATVRRDLAALARVAGREARGPVEIEVATMSDREIRRVNREALGHDWATDVVSFPLSEPRERPLVGALAVSRDTARREAASRGHSPYDEWMLYVVHGTLHLLGFDDRAPRDRARMRRAERRLLEAIGRRHVYGGGA